MSRRKLAPLISQDYEVTVTECTSQVGSGTLPTETFPSYGLSINGKDNSDQSLRKFSAVMRSLPTPVIGRIHNGSYLLDLRCLDNESDFIDQLDLLVEALG